MFRCTNDWTVSVVAVDLSQFRDFELPGQIFMGIYLQSLFHLIQAANKNIWHVPACVDHCLTRSQFNISYVRNSILCHCMQHRWWHFYCKLGRIQYNVWYFLSCHHCFRCILLKLACVLLCYHTHIYIKTLILWAVSDINVK